MTDLHIQPQQHDELPSPYANLGGVDAVIAQISQAPRKVLIAAIISTAVMGWIWLGFMALAHNEFLANAEFGPGMQLLLQGFAMLGQNIEPSQSWFYWLAGIVTPHSAGSYSWLSLTVTFSMWFAMAIAMMLPSAAPLLRTYADIADVARRQNQTTAPVWVLAAGYLAVWALFAALASLLQLAMASQNLITAAGTTSVGIISASILIGAGSYQFSNLKHACLEKCRNPFNTLFARWTPHTFGVFKLGVEQGLFCLGCCWAIMSLMFVVGTMNLVWMTLLTAFTIFEKKSAAKVTTPVFGFILLLWGGILLMISVQ